MNHDRTAMAKGYYRTVGIAKQPPGEYLGEVGVPFPVGT